MSDDKKAKKLASEINKMNKSNAIKFHDRIQELKKKATEIETKFIDNSMHSSAKSMGHNEIKSRGLKEFNGREKSHFGKTSGSKGNSTRNLNSMQETSIFPEGGDMTSV